MARLFEIAAQIATPLGLAGIVVIALFFLYRALIKGPLATQLSQSHNFRVINRLITYFFIIFLVVIAFSIGAYLVVQLQPAPTVEEPTGFLSPGNAPTPATVCDERLGPLPPGEFVLLGGSNAVRLPRARRQTIVVMIKGDPLLWIDYEDQGIYVSGTIMREDGRWVATLRHNQFAINPNNYYELQRPNRHELTVLDQSGTRVLHAEFLNEQAFRIKGHFVQPGYGTLTIQADKIAVLIPERPLSYSIRGTCYSNLPVAFLVP